MTADVIALWPALAAVWLVFGLFGFLAAIAERRQKSIDAAKRHHPASRARQERHEETP